MLAPAYLLRQAEALARQNARSLDRLATEQAEADPAGGGLPEGRGTGTPRTAHRDGRPRFRQRDHDHPRFRRRAGQGTDREATAEILADLSEAADEAASAVEQLRVFGPSRSGKVSRVRLRALVERAGGALRRALPRAIEVKLDLGGDPIVRAEEGHLLRVITNLALNGRDAMRGRGTLTLRLREAEGGAEAALDVVDTGEGMSDEVKRHLFEPFFTTKGDRGTGLGLASVQDLVQGAGGRLEVESAPGRGSTFTVYLPVASPTA